MNALQLMCPACLGQQASIDSTLALVGALVMLPFLIAFFVIRAIKKLDEE